MKLLRKEQLAGSVLLIRNSKNIKKHEKVRGNSTVGEGGLVKNNTQNE